MWDIVLKALEKAPETDFPEKPFLGDICKHKDKNYYVWIGDRWFNLADPEPIYIVD